MKFNYDEINKFLGTSPHIYLDDYFSETDERFLSKCYVRDGCFMYFMHRIPWIFIMEDI